jgi:hypothetical protein
VCGGQKFKSPLILGLANDHYFKRSVQVVKQG